MIFFCYRRDDSGGRVLRIYDRLRDRFGESQVFLDRETIQPGESFVDVLTDSIAKCAVQIVVIGRQWLDATNRSGTRRLDDPNDFVRMEIETALNRNVKVIPALVDDASMPGPADLPPAIAALAGLHAFELADRSFDRDIAELIIVLEKALATTFDVDRQPERPSDRWRKMHAIQEEREQKRRERERQEQRRRKEFDSQPVDIQQLLQLSLEDTIDGCEKVVDVGGRPQPITLRIPAGIATGQRLRIKGEGKPSRDGRSVGDLYIVIQVQDHPLYQRDGDDLHTTLHLRSHDLGTTVRLPPLGKEIREIRIPDDPRNGAVLRYQGRGVPKVTGRGSGDLYVTVAREDSLFERVRDIFG